MEAKSFALSEKAFSKSKVMDSPNFESVTYPVCQIWKALKFYIQHKLHCDSRSGECR